MASSEEMRRTMRRLELRTKRLVESSFAGQYQSLFKGSGMNFEEVRPYAPGDEIRRIDWNVTARTGEPFIKKFTEEREITVMILLDISRSGSFGSHHQSKREIGGEVAALLSWSALYNNDKVGLLLFSEDVELFLPPRKGRSHHLRLFREMLYFEPKDQGTNIERALEYLNRVITRRALVFLISDFWADGIERPLSVTSQRHDLVALPLIDPMERELPNIGRVTLEDAEQGDLIELDTSSASVRRDYAAQARAREEKLYHLLGARNIDVVPLVTNQDYLPPLRSFFALRQQRRNR